jgi:hypothetical protein
MYYVKYTEEYDSEDITIEDLIVTTNYGDIIFPSDDLKDPNKPVVVGSLKAPRNIEQFGIVKAVANINGNFFDVTKIIIPARNSSIEIVKLSEENRTCPFKVLDFYVVEGILDYAECEENCLTKIVVNGKPVDFYYNSDLSYFFDNKDNIGKKLKLFVKVNQYRDYDDDSLTSFICSEMAIISSFVVLPK